MSLLTSIFRKISWKHLTCAAAAVVGTVLFANVRSETPEQPEGVAPPAASLPKVPLTIPGPAEDGIIYLPTADGTFKATNLDPRLQTWLSAWLQDRGAPIATVVVAEAKTGRILAMAGGRDGQRWGSVGHPAVHNKFPAASLFKTVVTAAAYEMAEISAHEPFGLHGGCGHVSPNGVWMNDQLTRSRRGVPSGMSLKRAYGLSCNGFYAKIALNQLGLGIITSFARRLGYSSDAMRTDFAAEPGHMLAPSARNSSAYTVGRFAAGFGHVGTSAVHVAWQMLAIANDGVPIPLRLFRDTPAHEWESDEARERSRVLSASTASALRETMDATVRGGTASFAFARGKYRKLRNVVGGKTGTLTGKTPAGLTTLFSGIMPLEAPEIVVASIVILEDRWIVKAPTLAAEALAAWSELKAQDLRRVAAGSENPSTSRR